MYHYPILIYSCSLGLILALCLLLSNQSKCVTFDQKQGEHEGSFDFAFVDANKDGYLKYHEQLLKLVKIGGVIAYDNTLWYGTVIMSEDDEMEYFLKKDRKHIMELNNFLAIDPRIEASLISLGDGLTLCRRLY